MFVKDELNELPNKAKAISTKDYNFLLSRIYITSNDGIENIFAFQLTSSTIKLRGINIVSSWESKGIYVTNLVQIKKDFFT